MNHTAISNPYNMEVISKYHTPADIQVNGKRAVCHKCGPVRVKMVKSFHFGKLPTKDRDEDGNKVYEPVGIRLCSNCNSVIQTAPPAPRPKGITAEGKANPKIYALLAHLIHGEREGPKLARMLEVTQPTMWNYLWELARMGLVIIRKEGKNASLKMTDVTEEGLHYFDAEKK